MKTLKNSRSSRGITGSEFLMNTICGHAIGQTECASGNVRDTGIAELKMHRSKKVGESFPFTLIELLVVIAVIAVLAGMLLPALGSAKDTAKRAICTSNTKNISVNYFAYADMYNDYMIPNKLYTNDPRFVDGMTNKSSWATILISLSPEMNTFTGKFYNLNYVTSPSWIKCPSAVFTKTVNSNSTNYEGVNGSALNYTMLNLCSSNIPRHQKRLGKIKTPARCVNIMDGHDKYNMSTRMAIPGTGNGPFDGKGTPNLYCYRLGGETHGAMISFNSTKSEMLAAGAATDVNWSDKQKDFFKGRHGFKNILLFYDGHAEGRTPMEVGNQYWNVYKSDVNSGKATGIFFLQ